MVLPQKKRLCARPEANFGANWWNTNIMSGFKNRIKHRSPIKLIQRLKHTVDIGCNPNVLNFLIDIVVKFLMSRPVPHRQKLVRLSGGTWYCRKAVTRQTICFTFNEHQSDLPCIFHAFTFRPLKPNLINNKSSL